MPKKLTTKEFIEKAKKVHGDRFDYSLVDYEGAFKPIKIICRKHGIFEQTPSNHLQGQGCKECQREKQILSRNEFINRSNKIHKFKYSYNLVKYDTLRDTIKIICPKHGIFTQQAESHLMGYGCKRCATELNVYNQSSNTREFIRKAKKIHGDRYDYSKVNYINCKTPITIICKKHGAFEQTPDNHIQGKGCKFCIESKGEKEIFNLLKSKDINFISEYRFDDCRDDRPLPFDFYLPKYNICIEYDGIQHFEEVAYWGGKQSLDRQHKHDKIKTDYCKKNNISLLRINYKENIEDKLNQFLLDKCKIEVQSIFDL